jgi:serine/threonine-protein kinase
MMSVLQECRPGSVGFVRSAHEAAVRGLPVSIGTVVSDDERRPVYPVVEPRVNRWGDFELLEEIGQGSFGTVYRANHPTLQQQVALKLVPVPSGNPREIEKALDEPRRLASVRHQHVVVVHDARILDGHVGICMELVRGESLAQVISRHGRLGAEETIACGANLCRALAAIHRAAIIHNDVKAQNVMREEGGRIVLMDFGAGRRLLDPSGTTGLYLVGTPTYMAPELFELRPPSPASDIYSLGVLLFYLLTAEFPVQAGSMEQFAEAHARRHRRYLGDVRDDIPTGLLTVVDRALEHDPADRYHSCGEMLSGLSGLGTSERTRPRRVKVVHPKRQVPRTAAGEAGRLSPEPFTGARQWAVERIWTAAAVAAGFVAVVWLLGFMASKAYSVMFLTGDFAEESALRWLDVGLSTLVLPVAYMLMALTVCVAVSFLWRMMTAVSPALESWSQRSSQRLAGVSARAGLMGNGALPTAVLLLQVLALGTVYLLFDGILGALWEPIRERTVAEHAHLARSNEPEWLLFCAVTSLLALAGGLAWAAIIRRRRSMDGGVASIAAGLLLTFVFTAMFAVPWRIYWESDFETVKYDSAQCFKVAERETQLLLICPALSAPYRSPIVNVNDPRLDDSGSSPPVNIFEAVRRERLQGDQ